MTIDDLKEILRPGFKSNPPSDRSEWVYCEPVLTWHKGLLYVLYLLYPIMTLVYLLEIIDVYTDKNYVVYWFYNYKLQNPYNEDEVINGKQLVSSIVQIDEPEYRKVYKDNAKWLLKHFFIATAIWLVIGLVVWFII